MENKSRFSCTLIYTFPYVTAIWVGGGEEINKRSLLNAIDDKVYCVFNNGVLLYSKPRRRYVKNDDDFLIAISYHSKVAIVW